MSISHKAFAFDWKTFESDELHTLIVQALESEQLLPLIRYIENHRAKLKDPYKGKPLDLNWQEMLENRDINEYSDFALTHFYNPAADMGVAEEWTELDKLLSEAERLALLGFPIRSENNIFDPGRMGSYFQAPAQVSASLGIVNELAIEAIESYKELLKICCQSDLGVYVTF
jgi:hypothetical protein